MVQIFVLSFTRSGSQGFIWFLKLSFDVGVEGCAKHKMNVKLGYRGVGIRRIGGLWPLHFSAEIILTLWVGLPTFIKLPTRPSTIYEFPPLLVTLSIKRKT